MNEPQKPIKKYKTVKNLYDDLTTYCSPSVKEKYLWTCYNCRGYGKVKDKTQSCVVEGLKMADYIPCDICGGKCQLNYEFYKEKFQEYLTNYENKLQCYHRDKKIYNSIRSKLTKDEWEWLNLYQEGF